MAVGYLTSKTLIETIVREGMFPKSQSTFVDSDFLAMANQEIRIGLVPSILQYHEEYYVRDSAPVTLVANQSAYAIPYRAIGGKFRSLFYQDTNGNLRSMSRISPDDRAYYQDSSFENNFIFFYIRGNEVVLLPSVGPNPTGSLVFSYFLRPNELVVENRTSLITNIMPGTTTTVFTVDNIPQSLTAFIQDGVTLTGFSTSSKLDIMQSRPGHKTISFDVTPTSIDTTNKTITFNNSDLDSSIIIGDYISFAGECIIPQIPADLQDVLAQRVILKCCNALGDAQGSQIATGKLGEMEKNTGTLIDNRSEGNPQKINNFRGTIRSAKFRYWGY
jgi:hypothetical protein